MKTAHQMFPIGVVAALLSISVLGATNTATETPIPSSVPAKVDPKADQILQRVGDFYKELKSASVNVSIATKVEGPGMRQEAWSKYDVAIERPNKFSIELKDGMGPSLISDGQTMITCIPAAKKYSEGKAPASLDELSAMPEIAMLSKATRLFFVDILLRNDPRAALLEGVTSVQLMGSDEINGVKTDHLKFTETGYAWDLWVQQGDQPFVVKVSPDVSKAMAEEGLKVEAFSLLQDWKRNPKIAPERFKFIPEKSDQKVATLVPPAEGGPNPLIGKDAPETKLKTLDGRNFDLAAQKDKEVVVLDFWTMWCAPCIKAMPMLDELAAQYRSKGVAFYAINEMEDKQQIQDFLKRNNIKIDILLDADGKIAQAYGVTGIPQTIIIDKLGKVHAIHIGLPPGLKEEIASELNDLVGLRRAQNP